MAIAIITLQPSSYLDPLPELTAPGRSQLAVDPSTFAGWENVLGSDADDIVLAPGDYSSWKLCRIDSASPSRRRLIRFADPDRKPWDRFSCALVSGFDFQAGAAGWIVHGLTVRGPVSGCYVRSGAERITFDSLLCEDLGPYGVRLFGNYNSVQNSVIRRTATGRDSVGVQIRVRGTPNIGNRVLDCEIYDCGDSVQVTHDSNEQADPLTECRDLIVEGNDLYLTEGRHIQQPDGTYAAGENAIDVKAGPRTTADSIEFRNNRVWGFRCSAPGTGVESDGAAVTLHRYAQRILFDRNIIFDCPLAFHEVPRDGDDPSKGSREVTVRANIITQICQYNPSDLGAVLRTRLAFRLEDNLLSQCHTLSALPKIDSGDIFDENTLYDIPLGEAETDWNAGTNDIVPANDMDDVLIERRRWTQHDRVRLHKARKKQS